MIPRLLIIDTNVLVAGVISSNSDSPVVQIVNGMLSGQVLFVLSPALLDEYRTVLLRPKLCKVHGLSVAEIDQLLTEIVVNAVWREPQQSAETPDPGDNHLWELLAQDSTLILVTGDKLLIDNPPDKASVISPSACLSSILSR